MSVHLLDREFPAKDVQQILRTLTGDQEKIGLALLNYYARTNLVPTTGKTKCRGRAKYSYADLILLCWLFRMKPDHRSDLNDLMDADTYEDELPEEEE